MGQRNTSLIRGGCDGAWRYERLSPEAIDEIWVRLRAGHAAKPTARQLGLSTGTVRAYLVRCGGIRPDPRRRAPGRLSCAEREEISRGLAAGLSLRAIAAGLGRAPSTISREVAANGGRRRYRAARADQLAWSRATRPKACKLAANPVLRAIVEEKLQRRWSPQQIAGWLKITYPDDPEMQVSHESIYRTLFVQSRGALRKELTALPAHRAGDPTPAGSPAARRSRWPARASCTSPNDQPRPRTGRCPGTGKATWSSAST